MLSHQHFSHMMLKIKARGYNRAKESFVDKWLDSCSLEDEQGVKDLKKALWRYMLAEAKHNRSSVFRLVLVSEDDEDDEDLIDFSSPKKKKKYDDDDDDDDE